MSDALPQARTAPMALPGVLLVVAVAAVRSFAMHEPFPGWSGDPFSVPEPIIGITPMVALGLDALMALGAGVAAAGAVRAGLGAGAWWGLLLAPFAAVAAWHARAMSANALDNAVQASAWTSALAAGWAVSLAGRCPACKRVLVAGLLGCVGAWFAKGVVQVVVEHPATLAAFRADPDSFFAAQGWSADSSMARAYVRRLEQPEASGWFGMANVYAGVMAAGFVGLGGVALAWVRRRARTPVRVAAPVVAPDPGRDVSIILLVLGAAVALAGLVLAFAKGGYACAALGVVLIGLSRLAIRSREVPSAVGWVLRREIVQRHLGTTIGVLAVVGVIGVVALRGAIGEGLGERSVLFRWFYVEAAARIAAAEPWAGVGPANFKDAYALAKTLRSPEDVSSPHSLLFDWTAMLGLAGLAAGVVWWGWVVRAGRALLAAPVAAEASERPMRREVLWVGAALACAVAVGVRLEAAVATPESALARLLGVLAGAATASAVLAAMRSREYRVVRGVAAALAAAGLVLASNAQMELTGTHAGSAAWSMLLVAAAGAVAVPATPGAARAGRAGAALAGLLPLALVGGVIGVASPRVVAWEMNLRAASASALTVGLLEAQWREVSSLPEVSAVPGGPSPRVMAMEEANRALREALLRDGLPAPATISARDLGPLMLALREKRAGVAAEHLERAMKAAPSHFGTLAALTRVEAARADLLAFRGEAEGGRVLYVAQVDRAEAFAKVFPSSAAWGWAGTLADAGGRGGSEAERAGLRRRAVESWAQAADLSPHGVVYPALLARAHANLGDWGAAVRWAEAALANDAKASLDPLAGLSDAVRDEMRAIVETATSRQTPDPGP